MKIRKIGTSILLCLVMVAMFTTNVFASGGTAIAPSDPSAVESIVLADAETRSGIPNTQYNQWLNAKGTITRTVTTGTIVDLTIFLTSCPAIGRIVITNARNEVIYSRQLTSTSVNYTNYNGYYAYGRVTVTIYNDDPSWGYNVSGAITFPAH